MNIACLICFCVWKNADFFLKVISFDLAATTKVVHHFKKKKSLQAGSAEVDKIQYDQELPCYTTLPQVENYFKILVCHEQEKFLLIKFWSR